MVNMYFIIRLMVIQFHLVLWKLYNYLRFHCSGVRPEQWYCQCCPDHNELVRYSGCPEGYSKEPQCDICYKEHLCCDPYFLHCEGCSHDICHDCYS